MEGIFHFSGSMDALSKDLDSSSADDYKKSVVLGLLYKVHTKLVDYKIDRYICDFLVLLELHW